MNRRTLLSLLAASTGFAAVPSWLRGQSMDDGASARDELARAFATAARDARPLLVVVVPTDWMAARRRGDLFGSWLTHGSDEQLAPLHACGLACGTMADVMGVAGDRLVLERGSDDTEPLLLHVPAGARSAITRVPDTISDDGPPMLPGLAVERHPTAGTADLDARIAALAAVVRATLGWSAPRAPSQLAWCAAEVRRRVGASNPPGARWWRAGNCGDLPERSPPGAGADVRKVAIIACGMGRVPAKSERFLHFLAEPAMVLPSRAPRSSVR